MYQKKLGECLVFDGKEPCRSGRTFGGNDAMLDGIAREIRNGAQLEQSHERCLVKLHRLDGNVQDAPISLRLFPSATNCRTSRWRGVRRSKLLLPGLDEAISDSRAFRVTSGLI